MTTDKQILINADTVAEIARVFQKTYQDYSLQLNNEIADILNKVKFNNKSRGLFGAVGQLFYNSNQSVFERLRNNIAHRRNVVESYKILCEAYKNVGGRDLCIYSTIAENNKRLQELLDELSLLLKINYTIQI